MVIPNWLQKHTLYNADPNILAKWFNMDPTGLADFGLGILLPSLALFALYGAHRARKRSAIVSTGFMFNYGDGKLYDPDGRLIRDDYLKFPLEPVTREDNLFIRREPGSRQKRNRPGYLEPPEEDEEDNSGSGGAAA